MRLVASRVVWPARLARLTASGVRFSNDVLALAPAVSGEDDIAEQAIDQHERVRCDEHPVLDEQAVDREADGCRSLPDEEPARDALGLAFLPLLPDLLADRDDEQSGAGPS